jgi:hypothetical protein
MAVTRSLKPLILAMRRDARYKRLKGSFDTLPMYQLSTDELVKEVETLHQMREIRRLNSADPHFVDNLIKANTSDQSIRGRLTEIIMTCVKATSSLDDAVDALRYHLLMTFTDELRSYRTKDERVQVVNMVLVNFTKYTQRIAVLKEITQMVVADIDKGAWALRSSVEALKLHTNRESNI